MKSDRDLIEAINKGDTQAFEDIYYRYRDWVYNLAWRFTANQQDALDVLQETFIYLLGKFPGFKLTASMMTFLYPVVRHLSMNLAKKNKKFMSSDETLEKIVSESKEDSEIHLAELAEVLKVLPDEQREILLMRFVDRMTLEEIANAVDIPVGTVKSRLHRALQTLREDNRTREYFLE